MRRQVFIDNKYTKFYLSIINKATTEERTKLKRSNPNFVYYERHHIIPRCIGGEDHVNNLVLLTAREHFLCHWLLTKMVFNGQWIYKLSEAFGAMSMTKRSLRNLSSKQFEISRRYQGLASSHRNTGVAKSDDHKRKISQANRGFNKGKSFDEIHGTEKADLIRQKMSNAERPPIPEDVIEKRRKSNTGKKRDESFVDQCKIKNKGSGNPQHGKTWINDTLQNKIVLKNELEHYLSSGWVKGRLVPWNHKSQ